MVNKKLKKDPSIIYYCRSFAVFDDTLLNPINPDRSPGTPVDLAETADFT